MSATPTDNLRTSGDPALAAALHQVSLDVVAGWKKVPDGRPPLAETGKYRNPSFFACSGYAVVLTAYQDGTVKIAAGRPSAPTQGYATDALGLGALGCAYSTLVKAMSRKRISETLARRSKLREDADGRRYLVVGVYNLRTSTFVEVTAVIPLRPATADEAMGAVILHTQVTAAQPRAPRAEAALLSAMLHSLPK